MGANLNAERSLLWSELAQRIGVKVSDLEVDTNGEMGMLRLLEARTAIKDRLSAQVGEMTL